MPTVSVPPYGEVRLPDGVTSLGAFRQWIHSRPLPEKLAAHFLRGEVWVDFHMEEAFSHNLVKTAVYVALALICERKGLFFCDGMLLTNDDAGLGTEPDAMFVSNASLKAGRAEFTAGEDPDAHATEMVGVPDLVVEVVSRTTEDKDTEWLMAAYHNAGIPEYWLIDAREDEVRFTIYKRGAKEYLAVPDSGGWVRSAVLRKSFRLTRKEGPGGYPRYKLEVR